MSSNGSRCDQEKTETQQNNLPTDVSQPAISEHCKSLETWLNNVYIQRAVATSAYFTAYSLLFGNNNPLSNGPQGRSYPRQQQELPNFFNPEYVPNRDNRAAAVAEQQYPGEFCETTSGV